MDFKNKLNLGGTTLSKRKYIYDILKPLHLRFVCLLALCVTLISAAWAQPFTGHVYNGVAPSILYHGLLNYNSLVTQGTSALRSPVIAHSEFDASQGSGEVVSNVNVFNGQPVYQIPLMGINARNILSWNLSLTYNGSAVRPILQSSNKMVTSGAYGLGWSMSTPFVSINHMGTASTMDDVIYCDLGPYGGGQIVQNSDGKFFLSTNPYIRIMAMLDSAALVSGKMRIVSWQFFMPDGNRMFFGETDNSRRTQRSRGNVVAAHPATAANGEDFIYRFDLSRYTTFDESTQILFNYSQIREPVSATESYVRESALSSVYWQSSGVTVDSIALCYENMDAVDYPAYGSLHESRDAQRLFESRMLSGMQLFVRGRKIEMISILYGFFGSNVNDFSHLKVPYQINDSIVVGEMRRWRIGYDTTSKMINYVALPDRSTEHFLYEKIDVGSYSSLWSPRVADTMRNVAGNVVDLSLGNINEFRNSVNCMEEFCFAQLSTAKIDNNDLYVQVYRNDGNYFSTPMNFEILGRKNPVVWYSSDYFVMADVGGRLIKFFEWDGRNFVNRNAGIGGFFLDSLQLVGTIEKVYLQPNYALIQEKDASDVRYIHVLVKDQLTGGWRLLNSSSGCGFANTANYGETIRNASSNHCLEWNSPIDVETSPSLFVVGVSNVNVLNIFGFDGATFHDLSSVSGTIPDMNLQKNSGLPNVFTMDFLQNIENITLSGNTLVLAFKQSGIESVLILYFDGVSFMPMAFNSWPYANDNGPMYFAVRDNYILGISPSLSNVILWRKRTDTASSTVVFDMVDPNFFPFDAVNNEVNLSCTEDAFFIEEKKKNSSLRTIVADGSKYYNRLVVVPSDPSAILFEYTPELAPYITNLNFSPSDPIVYYENRSKVAGGLCDVESSCYISPRSRTRKILGTTFFAAKEEYEQSLNIVNQWYGNVFHATSPNRLIMASVNDYVSNRNLIGIAQYMGKNYSSVDSIYVVKRQWKHNGLDSTKSFTFADFVYVSPTSSGVEYNSHTQQIQFESPLVTFESTNGSVASSSRYYFVMDKESSPLYGYRRNQQGNVKRVRSYDTDGDERNSMQFVYAVDSGLMGNWPDGLIVNLLMSTISVTTDYYGNKVSSVTRNVLLDSLSGQFRGTVTYQGDKFLFKQQVLQTQSVDWFGDTVKFRNPFTQYQYVPFDSDPIPTIQFANPNGVIFPDSVAAASRSYYISGRPHALQASFNWQPTSRNGVGVTPYNWFVLSDSVVSMNAYGQVTESASRSVAGMRNGCVVYEGLRNLPTATFSGAACSDVAATTAEHGDLNGWYLAQTELDSNQVYDGLYSFLVTDGYGPTRNIPLKEINRYKYDYVVSAYGYSTGTYPILMVELRRGDDSLMKVFASYSPVDGPFVANRWQRYEVEIPYDSLVAGGMFVNPARGDYLRIWFGFGLPVGDASRQLYVDDFVAYPTSTLFVLNSYDILGHPLSSINDDFEKQEIVYDKNHRKRAIRDSRGRIHSDNAKHQMNENVRMNHE